MLELDGVSKNYEQSLTLFAGAWRKTGSKGGLFIRLYGSLSRLSLSPFSPDRGATG
jgi:hypothetical protein